MAALNLRARQKHALLRMLNLNEEPSSSSSSSSQAPGMMVGMGGAQAAAAAAMMAPEVYKVLVLDPYTRDVLSPVLRLNELRRTGVTLLLMVDGERQAVPDVPAVYFCRPTSENVERIAQDLATGTYEVAHVNFSAPCPDRCMGDLAAGLLKGGPNDSGCVSRLARCHDQFLGFVCLEPDLFSLALPRSYVTLNDPQSRDGDIEAAVATIVEGLFCVCATLGAVPIIRCQRGGVAEHVARGLEEYLRKHLSLRDNAFAPAAATHGGRMGGMMGARARPLLVLFDRNFDLSPQLQHPWSYQGLVHDVLGLRLGRVANVATDGDASGGSGGGSKRQYDVGPEDFFWVQNGSKPFPKVAEDVEAQLNKYKRDMAAINAETAGADGAAGLGGAGMGGEEDARLEANTKQLMNAGSSLPELTERKRVIDKHTNIATALLGEIKQRQLDAFCSAEEELLAGKADKAAVLKTLAMGKGSPSDKLRLALVWLLSAEPAPPNGDVDEVADVLKGAGADVAALAYVRRLRTLGLAGSQKAKPVQVGPGGGAGGGGERAILDFADKLYAQSLSAVQKGVKTLMGAGRASAAARVVQGLLEGKQGTEADG